MYKIKKLILIFIIFVTFVLVIINVFSKYSYAQSEVTNWNIKITGGTNEETSKNTDDIMFIIQDNPNVAKGKFAPGCTAIANIDLDLVGTKYSVDFMLNLDSSSLIKNMNVVAKIDNENYQLGTTKVFELQDKQSFDNENGKKKIQLILTWDDLDYNDFNESFVLIPIQWTAKQHV